MRLGRWAGVYGSQGTGGSEGTVERDGAESTIRKNVRDTMHPKTEGRKSAGKKFPESSLLWGGGWSQAGAGIEKQNSIELKEDEFRELR